MKDKKSMAMIIIIGIVISLFLFVNSTVFATTGVVITNDLRVRKEESTSSEIIEILDENNKVEIISENGEWYKVKANGKIGYVSKQYVKVEDNNEAKNESASNENTTNETNNENKPEEVAENNNAEANQAPEVKEQPKTCKFTSDVELKVMPLICGNVIDNAKNGETYTIISTAGVWSYVKSDSKAGWVLTEKVTPVESTESNAEANQENKEQENIEKQEENKPEEKQEEKKSTEKKYSKAKTYYVKGTSVNARSEANKASNVVKVFNTNSSVKVTGEDGDWYVIDINGDKAYIAKSLLSSEKVEVTSRSSTSLEQNSQNSEKNEAAPAPQQQEEASSAPSNPSGSAIVAYAKQFLGYSYVYGTNGPNTFDCSGFVQYVYKHFGYSLSRSSGTQANDGVAVSKSNLEPGDVLIFRDTSNSRIGHVGLYIGGGQFIHASNSRTGVIISDLSSASYQKRYVGARRIL